jgi:hypothetical protein
MYHKSKGTGYHEPVDFSNPAFGYAGVYGNDDPYPGETVY